MEAAFFQNCLKHPNKRARLTSRAEGHKTDYVNCNLDFSQSQGDLSSEEIVELFKGGYVQVRRENEQLKRENEQLKRENEQLKRENEQLKRENYHFREKFEQLKGDRKLISEGENDELREEVKGMRRMQWKEVFKLNGPKQEMGTDEFSAIRNVTPEMSPSPERPWNELSQFDKGIGAVQQPFHFAQVTSLDSDLTLDPGLHHHHVEAHEISIDYTSTNDFIVQKHPLLIEYKHQVDCCSSMVAELYGDNMMSMDQLVAKMENCLEMLKMALDSRRQFLALVRANLVSSKDLCDIEVATLSEICHKLVEKFQTVFHSSHGEGLTRAWQTFLDCFVILESNLPLTFKEEEGPVKKRRKDIASLHFRFLGGRDLVAKVTCQDLKLVSTAAQRQDDTAEVSASVSKEDGKMVSAGHDTVFPVVAKKITDFKKSGTNFVWNFYKLRITLCLELQGGWKPSPVTLSIWSLPFNIRKGSSQIGWYRAATQVLTWARLRHLYEPTLECPLTLSHNEVLQLFVARLEAAVPGRPLTSEDKQTLLERISNASSSGTDVIHMPDVVSKPMVHTRRGEKLKFALMTWLEGCANTIKALKPDQWNKGYIHAILTEQRSEKLLRSQKDDLVGTVLYQLSLNHVDSPQGSEPCVPLIARFGDCKDGKKGCLTIRLSVGEEYEKVNSVRLFHTQKAPSHILDIHGHRRPLSDLLQFYPRECIENDYKCIEERLAGITLVKGMKTLSLAPDEEKDQPMQSALEVIHSQSFPTEPDSRWGPGIGERVGSSSSHQDEYPSHEGNIYGKAPLSIMPVQGDSPTIAHNTFSNGSSYEGAEHPLMQDEHSPPNFGLFDLDEMSLGDDYANINPTIPPLFL